MQVRKDKLMTGLHALNAEYEQQEIAEQAIIISQSPTPVAFIIIRDSELFYFQSKITCTNLKPK